MERDVDPRVVNISTRAGMIALGYDDRALARGLRTGALARPRRGAYVDGHTWETYDLEEKFIVRSRAAHLQARTSTVLSHTSALAYHGLPLWGLDLEDAHLTRLTGSSGRAGAQVRQHRDAIWDEHVLHAHDVAVMSAARALIEVTTISATEASLAAACAVLRRGLSTPKELAELARRADRWPGSLKTDLVVRLADPRIESVGEARLHWLMYRQGLPRPIPQYEVADAGLGFRAFLDFAYPDDGVWVEFDGIGKYGDDPAEALLAERRRERLVVEMTGWIPVRIVWADLAHPERTAARIRAAIATQAARKRASGA